MTKTRLTIGMQLIRTGAIISHATHRVRGFNMDKKTIEVSPIETDKPLHNIRWQLVGDDWMLPGYLDALTLNPVLVITALELGRNGG